MLPGMNPIGALGVFIFRQIKNLQQAPKFSPVSVQRENTLGWEWETLIAPIVKGNGAKYNGSVVGGKTGPAPTPISPPSQPLLADQILPSAHMPSLHPGKCVY